MSLVEQYRRQYQWRDWKSIMQLCPIMVGNCRILDLGCAIGDLSEQLLLRGATEVIGIDSNDELLTIAREKHLENCNFIQSDLLSLDDKIEKDSFDGIWCSFTIAYFPPREKMMEVLNYWKQFLKSGGWICLVEMSDLLNHGPLPEKYRPIIDRFYKDSYDNGRYDFTAGSKIISALSECGGYELVLEKCLQDEELSKSGPVSAEIVEAWRRRFHRMNRLKLQFETEEDYEEFVAAFLDCLQGIRHISNCIVKAWFAKRVIT